MTKLCITCGEEKQIDQFYYSRGKPAGACKVCRAIQVTKYANSHPEVRKTSYRNYKNSRTEDQIQVRLAHQRELAIYRSRALKLEAMSAYGDVCCSCCGEDILEFLTIDHVHGNGRKHRRETGSGSSSTQMYRWLRDNNYPEGFQVLCFNCNTGRYINGGVCPHKERNTK